MQRSAMEAVVDLLALNGKVIRTVIAASVPDITHCIKSCLLQLTNAMHSLFLNFSLQVFLQSDIEAVAKKEKRKKKKIPFSSLSCSFLCVSISLSKNFYELGLLVLELVRLSLMVTAFIEVKGRAKKL
ncbi:hypothetical protein IMY05_006G0106600 [Salix suchowensis]|nr:hypothetical protein IMY05_006G0106600 [Salix suchowensis]